MADAKVNWYGNDVLAKVEGATEEALLALALSAEGLAKLRIQQNGQIDTGFMLNSVYALGGGSEPWESGRYEGSDGRATERRRAPSPAAQPGAAAVHAAAEYAIYQEAEQPFLYPALAGAVSGAAATIEPVYRERIGGNGDRR